MNNVVSFSGGRTSAYLVHLMEQKRKAGEIDNVHYVFMDTGAEHPKTYEFIRKCVDHFGIDLVCLRAKVNPEKGVGVTYQEVKLSDCKPDLEPFRNYTAKYGVPYILGASCTARMKTDPFDKWCKDKFGVNNHRTWLGIRIDEGRRLKEKEGIHYLAELSVADKNTILGWWKQQPFDLEIDEWLGNCVFCLKKATNKLALAARQEPRMAHSFNAMLSSDNVRTMESRPAPNNAIYRNWMTLPAIIEAFEPFTDDEIKSRMRGNTSACTESCEVFGCQGDLFDE